MSQVQLRADFDLIAGWVQPGERVLDLGCGDGALLRRLIDERGAKGYGVELEDAAVLAAIANGINVIEQDLDRGLGNFGDQSFDTVVMTQTLQAVRFPHLVLDEMLRIGRELRSGSLAPGADVDAEFQVQSYLRYQGDVFADGFDANTYLLMTRALDRFDLARDYGDDAVAAFRRAAARFMVVSFSSDWRFSPARSREIVDALIAAGRDVSYTEIEAAEGHDAFLLPIARYHEALALYLDRVHREAGHAP